jgi:outer membrane protein TolC
MARTLRRWQAILLGVPALVALAVPAWTGAQEPAMPAPDKAMAKQAAVNVAAPAPRPDDRPYPINLPTALKLASVRDLDIELASAQIRIAAAQFDRAKVLWLPTLLIGGDYFRQDGSLQDSAGNIVSASKSSLMAGAAPSMIFAVTEAIFEPLATRQVLRAREANFQAATNDALLAVAEAYFNVQQARGELAGAEDALAKAVKVAETAKGLKEDLVPAVEATRAQTEVYRRRQVVHSARERWRVASAELSRLLRLDGAVLVDPLESPALQISLVPPETAIDDLIAQALTSRPELAAQQALVQATLRRLREEKIRPFVPSVLLRGAATNPAGTLSSGVFGGGIDGRMGDASFRNTMDLQLLWELQNLGLGNRARKNERKAEHDASVVELFRVQDRVAAEVVQAQAQVRSAAARIEEAEAELRDAALSATQNIEGMSQTKRPGGNILLLVIRPQEAVAAVQALAQAYLDYYGSVADYNRAQFRLYRALGQPAEHLIGDDRCCPNGPGSCVAPVLPPPQQAEP